jgi:DNA-binding YbaB/EbfC family protein
MSEHDDRRTPEVIEGDLVPEGLGGPTAPGAAGFDLGSMMQMAQDMQQQVAQAQEQLASSQVVGTAGGGAVSVTLNGHLHLVGVEIGPDAADPDDPSMLEDLILAAWQDAHDQVAALQAQADPLGGLGGMLGGGLGDLLGGA